MHLAFLVTSGSKVRLQTCLEVEPTSLRISGYKGGKFFLARSITANSGRTVVSCTSERPDFDTQGYYLCRRCTVC